MALEIMATRETVDRKEASTCGLHETPSMFSQQLGVALNRALQRRLGKAPSPTVASKATEAISGTKGLAFVRHAVRVQEQLADLHAKLQRDQERHGRATEAPKDSAVPSTMGPRKRSVGHDDETTRETKRIRVENKGPHRHMPPPAPDDGPKPDPEAPGIPMSPKGVSIASRLRSNAKPAEITRSDTAKTKDDSSSRLPITGAVPSTPSDNTNFDSNGQTGAIQHSPLNGTLKDGNREQASSQAARRGGPASGDPGAYTQNKLNKALSLSISASIPNAQGSPLSTSVASPAMGIPVYTRQQPPSPATPNAFVANVPRIWAIQVGKPSASHTDVEFVVDQDTASSVRRWAAHKREFDPDARHVVVHLVALQTTAVTTAQQNLSQSPGGITPQAFALAIRDLQPRWPDDGGLVLQLNAGQPGEQTWLSSDISGETPLDISGAVCVGTNSLRITQLRNMADTVFAIYAAPPTPEIIAAAVEWERGRKWASFRRPRSGCLPA